MFINRPPLWIVDRRDSRVDDEVDNESRGGGEFTSRSVINRETVRFHPRRRVAFITDLMIYDILMLEETVPVFPLGHLVRETNYTLLERMILLVGRLIDLIRVFNPSNISSGNCNKYNEF